MKLPMRFNVGSSEFLIPEDYVGNYGDIVEEVEKANRDNPPSKGQWYAGSCKSGHINFLASLDELGVLPKKFFDLPLVSGSYWINWKNGVSDAKYKIGYGRPHGDGSPDYIDVRTSSPQSVFLTNWTYNVGQNF